MNVTPESYNQLQQEVLYYKKQLEQLSGDSIRNDFLLSSLRHELRYVQNSFSALTSLQNELTVDTSTRSLISKTLRAIHTHLGIDRSIYLTPSNKLNTFTVNHLEGFSDVENSCFQNQTLRISSNYLHSGKYLLYNKSSPADETSSNITKTFSINFFIGVPVVDDDKLIAFIIAAQQLEKLPFHPPLNESNVNTLIAVSNLIATFYQNKRLMKLQLQKAEVDKRNKLIAAQRDKLKKTLIELRATQKQLIQFEKMAFLGELTSGIAHEIQNPINFVMNFSELGIELLEELKDELPARGRKERLSEIMINLNANLKKIYHHGRRADEIVKTMLLHSRPNTSKKELISIHNLIEENLLLSYHSVKVNGRPFVAKLKMDFDPTIGKVKIVSQDIARVFLNIFNNSFYSLIEKQKQTATEYEPSIAVTSCKRGDIIEISILDNGLGIPSDILDKVFQPFFTTKPPGQGTGLGLSLSFDIITNGHNGQIKADSKLNEYTKFSILLPVK